MAGNCYVKNLNLCDLSYKPYHPSQEFFLKISLPTNPPQRILSALVTVDAFSQRGCHLVTLVEEELNPVASTTTYETAFTPFCSAGAG